MKYLLVDFLFALVYVVILALGFFNFLDVLFVIVLFLLVLVFNGFYGFAVSENTEQMGEEFVRYDERRAKTMKRRLIMDRMISIVDTMIGKVKYLRLFIKGELLIAE